MANKFGFSSVNQQVTQGSNNQSSLTKQIEEVNLKVIYGRVTDIILEETHPKFPDFGQWSSIGTIFFEPVEAGSLKTITNGFAKPLLPNFKNFPVVNELVLLFLLPDQNILLETNSTSYYYINPINVWNRPTVNTYPNVNKIPQVQESQRKNYEAIEQGLTRKTSNEQVQILYNSPLIGGTFNSSSAYLENIRPLLPFAGDVINEGRWGNSIRLGGTSRNLSNDWSSNGENGQPITIIRNGQPQNATENVEGFIPITENINNDLSSIYLTSTQTIPLNTEITSFPSINNGIPSSITSYTGSQVILNSDRLVFNSKVDSIILNSQNSTAISSIKDIGLYSKKGNVNLVGGEIKLGDVNANQSLILGDNFLSEFKDLIERLENLCEALSTEPKLFISGPAANSVKVTIMKMLNNFDNYKSKISKTI